MAAEFVHLHNHTDHSLLDGAQKIPSLLETVADLGMDAVGVTEHGNMFSAVNFYKKAKNNGIKPIIGCEAYVAQGDRFDKTPKRDGGWGNNHLVLLAQNYTGYQNLMKLSTAGYLEGFYYRPRVDKELLKQYSDGIICLSACLKGEIQELAVKGDVAGAKRVALEFAEIFPDRFYLELHNHGIPEEDASRAVVKNLAKELDLPLVASNDCHYALRDHWEAHDILFCVGTGKHRDDPNRQRYATSEFYFKTQDQMWELFKDYPDALENTRRIADACELELPLDEYLLPTFPIPESAGSASPDDYLAACCQEGLKAIYPAVTPELRERLAYELDVIRKMGFAGYFLIVMDFVKFAKDNHIPVGPGRGSVAGSLVAYCLGITAIDPIKHNLLFERFLNPERISMPDIDIDFCYERRSRVIDYIKERYGEDSVTQIITFGKLKARQVVRDVGRVLGMSFGDLDKIAKSIPAGPGVSLESALEISSDLQNYAKKDNQHRDLIEHAKTLEGMNRHVSTHAAGVVIAPGDLTDYIPLYKSTQGDVTSQYDMKALEDLGLLKMDFLGLRNLDVITDTLALIEATCGEVLDIDDVPLDDLATFELLARGDTIGVFQLESGPMRSLMRSLAPTTFEDVAALVALYRPGPMAANMHNDYADRKNGRQAVSYFHPDAEKLLSDTYGLMIYQESVMRVAQKFAGYSLAQADNLRKACGKKIREMMAKERDAFVKGCEETGYGGALGDELFDVIEQFADYAFNKSHSYGYGLIAYQIAYLKAHYPVEYMAALLTSVKSNLDKAGTYLNECRIMGIEVGVPDVNTARSEFHALPDGSGTAGRIVFGLSAVRNVGEGLVELLLAERDANGPFTDFYDFVERCDTTVLNKRTVESLIKAGAFDSLGHPRQGLLLAHEQVIEHTLARRREHDMGVMSLFGDNGGAPSFDERASITDVEFDKSVRLAFEKEMLGLYVSDHPLLGYEAALRRRVDIGIVELADVEDGMQRTIGGVLTNLEKKWTRKGDLMAVFDLEDLGGSVEVMVFPRTMTDHGHKLEEDAIVLVRGRLDTREDVPKVVCHEVEVVEVGGLAEARPVRVRLPIEQVSEGTVTELKALLSAHPGDSEVYLHLGERQVLRLPSDFCVDPSSGLVGELRVLLGAEAVVAN